VTVTVTNIAVRVVEGRLKIAEASGGEVTILSTGRAKASESVCHVAPQLLEEIGERKG